MVVRTVESWWNGSHAGLVRQRVRLRRDGDEWSVEVEGPQDRWTLYPEMDEPEARARVAAMTGGDGWRRIDRPNSD